jgi:hypothetical protein
MVKKFIEIKEFMRNFFSSVLFSKRECHFRREIIGKILCTTSDFIRITRDPLSDIYVIFYV